MVIVPFVARRWFEGDLVVGGGIRDAFLQQSGDIVVEVEGETAALGGDYREAKKRGRGGAPIKELGERLGEQSVKRMVINSL